MSSRKRSAPKTSDRIANIVVYIVERHPLEPELGSTPFRWLRSEDGLLKQLKGIIGPFDPENLSILKDPVPSGPAWHQLLESLEKGEIGTVVTHLAPLTSGQRQQLIGVCAFMGASLITPGDGGRSTIKYHPSS